MITITGKTSKKKKQLAEQAADYTIKRIMPRLANRLDITIQIAKRLDVLGYCDWVGDNPHKPREFLIQVRNGQNNEDFVKTIIHEMVHVKQYARGELTELGGHMKWKKGGQPAAYYDDMSVMRAKLDEMPWEKEAYLLEERLYQDYLSKQ